MTGDKNVTVTYYLFAVFAFLFGVCSLLIVLTNNVRPPLVGYGCEGAGGDLYAYEESDFPVCSSIESTATKG